jgi:hypothetical protein
MHLKGLATILSLNLTTSASSLIHAQFAHVQLMPDEQVAATQWAATKYICGRPLPTFRMGFHAMPSVPQLHLHVISQVRSNAVPAWFSHVMVPFIVSALQW